MKKKPLVSVIIPTRNASLFLERTLKLIRNQSYPNIEIIVIDGGSVDNTREIAEKYADIFRQFSKKGDYRSAQKNLGARIAKGKYILFLDSDARLTKGVITECVKLGNEGYQMVIIPEIKRGKGFWAKAKSLERKCYLGDDTIECPWFFNREIFLSVNGYDETMISGEDWDLFNRLKRKGYKYTRNKSFIIEDLGRISFFSAINKKRYYGSYILRFIKKNKRSAIGKIPFFRSAYFKNWRLLIRHPLLTLGFFTLKAGETIGLVIGMIESKVKKQVKDYYAK